MISRPSATEAELNRYRDITGEPSRGHLLARLFSLFVAVCESRRYSAAVSKMHGIRYVSQMTRLANAHVRVGMSAEYFYTHEYYQPERRSAWQRHVSAHKSQWTLIERHNGQRDYDSLWDKIAFLQAANTYGLPAVQPIGIFVDGVILESPRLAPQTDLFSKPSRAMMGNGATLWRYRDGAYSNSSGKPLTFEWQDLREYLRQQSKRGLLLQPAVQNHQKLRALTNGALATLRLVTCLTPTGSIDLMPPVLRMPWGAAIVDNFCKGGLVAPVDIHTGRIIGPAYRKHERLGSIREITHPDTGLAFEDFEVPLWREVIDLSAKAHTCFPSMCFIGWDIAILDEGPAIVEGNPFWGNNLIPLAHRLSLADTQFVPYWLHHYESAQLPTMISEPVSINGQRSASKVVRTPKERLEPL